MMTLAGRAGAFRGQGEASQGWCPSSRAQLPACCSAMTLRPSLVGGERGLCRTCRLGHGLHVR